MGRIIETFIGNDAVVRSTRVKMVHGELNRPVVKLAPVFYVGVSEIENRAGVLEPLQIRHLEKTFETEKLRVCQNSKMVKTENLGQKFCTPPDSWKGKPEQPKAKVIANG